MSKSFQLHSLFDIKKAIVLEIHILYIRSCKAEVRIPICTNLYSQSMLQNRKHLSHSSNIKCVFITRPVNFCNFKIPARIETNTWGILEIQETQIWDMRTINMLKYHFSSKHGNYYIHNITHVKTNPSTINGYWTSTLLLYTEVFTHKMSTDFLLTITAAPL